MQFGVWPIEERKAIVLRRACIDTVPAPEQDVLVQNPNWGKWKERPRVVPNAFVFDDSRQTIEMPFGTRAVWAMHAILVPKTKPRHILLGASATHVRLVVLLLLPSTRRASSIAQILPWRVVWFHCWLGTTEEEDLPISTTRVLLWAQMYFGWRVAFLVRFLGLMVVDQQDVPWVFHQTLHSEWYQT